MIRCCPVSLHLPPFYDLHSGLLLGAAAALSLFIVSQCWFLCPPPPASAFIAFHLFSSFFGNAIWGLCRCNLHYAPLAQFCTVLHGFGNIPSVSGMQCPIREENREPYSSTARAGSSDGNLEPQNSFLAADRLDCRLHRTRKSN